MSVNFSDIIKLFDGSGDFFEWVQKFELVAKLKKVNELESFLPLFLSGGAFLVYQGLSDKAKSDYSQLKQALLEAFSIDAYSAYDEMKCRCLKPNESVDVYLADIKRLAKIIDPAVSDKFLEVIFLSGLPEPIKKQLKASSVDGEWELADYVARKLIRSESTCFAAIKSKKIVCFECHEEGHTRRECPVKKVERCSGCDKIGHSASNCWLKKRKCFVCGDSSHLANSCPTKSPKN